MYGWHGHAYISRNTLDSNIMPYCVSGVLLSQVVRGRYGKRQNRDFRPLLLVCIYSIAGLEHWTGLMYDCAVRLKIAQ